MNSELFEILSKRLAGSPLRERARDLVVAAFSGPGALAGCLEGKPVPAPALPRQDPAGPGGVYLMDLKVQGFRGIGKAVDLELHPGPGLTLVVGRNGSGKSSLAEALEVAFTGVNRRWENLSAQWKEGWRNLHTELPAEIQVSLNNSGAAPLTLRRWWSEARLDAQQSELGHDPGTGIPFENSAWFRSLDVFRPFLSYNELGGILQGRPSDLYRALSAGLGLNELEEARELLRRLRLESNRIIATITSKLDLLLSLLRNLSDSRAEAALDALSGPDWDLERLGRLVAADVTAVPELEALHRIASLPAPPARDLERLLTELGGILEERRSLALRQDEVEMRVAELLEGAVGLAEKFGDRDCPVCRTGRLDRPWLAQAKELLPEVKRRARAAIELKERERRVRWMLQDFWPDLDRLIGRQRVPGVRLERMRDLRRHWIGFVQEAPLEELIPVIADLARELEAELGSVISSAYRVAEERQAVWIPVADKLRLWLSEAGEAAKRKNWLPDVVSAEAWIKSATQDIQTDRFIPIAAKAAEVWSRLRTSSNVDLERVDLRGSGSHGKVSLAVTIDGKPGVALGVMSQGELHSLALSLFIPRATRQDSPFRFIVIDDPVQSMDPARVDGLARVLEDCAKHRQVLVFTHDTRLSEAVRRLGIDGRILEVHRGAESQVTISEVSDSVLRHLDDARALLKTPNLPEAARRRTVPALCRLALETACVEALRRRWSQSGHSPEEIEELLDSPGGLSKLASWVFCGNPDQGSQVIDRLGKIGRWAVDTFRECNRGSHGETDADLEQLVKDTEGLARKVRRAQ